MIITVIAASRFTVKPGTRCHINLTAEDWIDSCCPCCAVKIYHAIHDTMICNGRTVHAKRLDTVYIFFYFVGAIQKTVFCMNMKMCKIHNLVLCSIYPI